MTQDELDRVLEQALDVEPPAGYVARVRARVAAEQAASAGGRAWWPLGALAAAVLVVVAGELLLERDDSPLPVTTVTSRGANTSSTPGSDPDTSGVASQPSAVTGPGGASVLTGATARNTTSGPIRHQPRSGAANAGSASHPTGALPPVLISPDDSAVLRLLVTFTESAPAAATTGSGERAALQISRIDVSPIDVGSLPELTPLALGELQ